MNEHTQVPTACSLYLLEKPRLLNGLDVLCLLGLCVLSRGYVFADCDSVYVLPATYLSSECIALGGSLRKKGLMELIERSCDRCRHFCNVVISHRKERTINKLKVYNE